MARKVTVADCTVDACRDEDQGAWIFVVNVEGAQIELVRTKLGGVDAKIAAAKAARDSEQS